MQIFATSADPVLSAQQLDTKRLNKMCTESAQIICTVLADDGVKDLPFKPTHEGNRLVKWAGDTHANLFWLKRHHVALCDEWAYRRGALHASRIAENILTHIASRNAPETFINAAKNELRALDFTWVKDVHLAYRMYLTARWMNDNLLPEWGKRGWPTWFGDWVFHDFELGKIYTEKAQADIGMKTNGVIPCPRCGNDLKFKDKTNFRCEGDGKWYPCLSWIELTE